MVRHVIFDFFGTLVSYRAGIHGNPSGRALSVLADQGVDLSAREFETRFAACFAELEAQALATLQEYSMHDAATRLFEELDHAVDADGRDGFVEAYLADWSDGVAPLPRLKAWFSSITQQKSVLTNTHHPGFVPAHLERLGVSAQVSRVTSSVEHGRRKPDPGIYRDHLAAIGCEAHEVLFVGDNADCDYHGPRSVGIQAYLVSPAPVPGVPETDRLAHLFELSERLLAL